MLPTASERSVQTGETPLSYSGYEAWKGWERYFECTGEDAEYFAGEMRGIPLAGCSILEIGFGQGKFLAWARSRGATVAGAEISNRSREEAQRQGIELLEAAIETIAHEHAGRFDVIAAFDVFEHFDLDEITSRIRAVEVMLKPGGFVILRFPNGQSPFGLAPQNADITHKAALSKVKLEQICQGTSLCAVRYSGSYRVRGPWGPRRLVRAMRGLLQRLIGTSLNLVYAQDIPWDAVVVLVMRKHSVVPGSSEQ